MAKLKTPLLSLGASQSIGGVVTFQKRGKTKFVRKKPIPFDPKSEAQLRRRFFYLWACQLWQGLTGTQKQAYETSARPSRITGFNLFLRTWLNLLPHLVAYYPFDEGQGSTTKDFIDPYSASAIIGASWREGYCGKCLDYDGINDHTILGNNTKYNLVTPFSIAARFYPRDDQVGNVRYIISKDATWALCYDHPAAGFKGSLAYKDSVLGWECAGPVAISKDNWHSLIGTYNGLLIVNYLDGVFASSTASVGGTPLVNTNDVIVGARTAIADFMKTYIDDVSIWDIALSEAQAAIISGRSCS